MTNYHYQVGGSLQIDAGTYVERKADIDLYNALISGEFCYVLNSRQMGKSSLKVRVKNRLINEGIACASIDMTRIGSEEITVEQWYKGIALDLLRGLKIFKKIKFKQWWQERKDISAPQRLIKVIEEIILTQIKDKKITIFIDEIDSVISLPFPSDDFFALIRSCYNQRAEDKEYDRLTFALFGVATPGDLIRDRTRTPFNVGKAIYLSGFKLTEARPLIKGIETKFSQPQEILAEILSWTGGQPFLTQKLCKMIATTEFKNSQNNKQFVENIVKNKIIESWESKDEPEHLKTIRDRILASEKQAGRLLALYQKILRKKFIKASDNLEQEQLLLSGLVVKEGGKIKVYNQIYRQVFNKEWVREQLNNLRPYAQSLNDWIASNRKDTSRLLRGTALKIARKWAIEKSLSDEDYQYLAASETVEQEEKQRAIEAQRLKEAEARLIIEQKNAKIQRRFLAAVSSALAIATSLGITAFWQYRQATIREIRAIAESSRSLYSDERQLEALIEAIKAKRKLENIRMADQETTRLVDSALGQTIYQISEFNRLSGHTDGIWDVDFTPYGSIFYATASWDGTVKLWGADGKLYRTIEAHQGRVFSVEFLAGGMAFVSASTDGKIKFWSLNGELIDTYDAKAPVYCIIISPDRKYIAAGTGDNTIQLWDFNGNLVNTFAGHTGEVYKLDFSPDGKYIASPSKDKTIKIWDVEKRTLLRTLRGHTDTVWELEFSKDGKTIVSASEDGTVKRWSVTGELLESIEAHEGIVMDAEYGPTGNNILSVGYDNALKIWLLDGTLTFVLKGHTDGILDLDYSPDGKIFASASWDKTVKLWRRNDFLLTNIRSHEAGVRGVGFSGDNQLIITASRDKTAKVWQDDILQTTFSAHTDGIYHLDVSPDGETIATVGMDRTLRIWKIDGTVVNNSPGHTDWITAVSWSPNGKYIVTGSWDNTAKLWSNDGELLHTFTDRKNGVLDVDFGPDSEIFATASQDRTVKIWRVDGTLVRTIKAHDLDVRTVAIDPRGEFFVSGSRDKTVKIWNMDGKLLKTITDHQERIWDVIFSPDGEIFATASDDNTIKLWNRNGKLLKTLYINYLVRSMAFSSDGKMLVTGARENITKVWNVSKILQTDELEYACNWVRDYLKNNPEVDDSDRYLCD